MLSYSGFFWRCKYILVHISMRKMCTGCSDSELGTFLHKCIHKRMEFVILCKIVLPHRYGTTLPQKCKNLFFFPLNKWSVSVQCIPDAKVKVPAPFLTNSLPLFHFILSLFTLKLYLEEFKSSNNS